MGKSLLAPFLPWLKPHPQVARFSPQLRAPLLFHSDFAIARQHLEAAIELSGIHQVKEQKGEFQSSNGYAKFGVKIKMYKYGEPNLYTRFSV